MKKVNLKRSTPLKKMTFKRAVKENRRNRPLRSFCNQIPSTLARPDLRRLFDFFFSEISKNLFFKKMLTFFAYLCLESAENHFKPNFVQNFQIKNEAYSPSKVK